jgi:predicted RNA binding protein YcfA (HicA-like mRNA interferase family)
MKAVSGKDFCRILEKHGWNLARISKSSHHIYNKPGIPMLITVPVHGNKDLKTGLLRKLMKLAGIKENDL